MYVNAQTTSNPRNPLHRLYADAAIMQRFTCHHLLQFNAVNLDYFTETVNQGNHDCLPLPHWTH